MNQPKFKFGDKVVMKKSEPCFKDNSVPFEVVMIALCEGKDKFEIHGDNNWLYEDEAELYKEPKEKKLYAYRHEGEVKFFVDKGLVMLAYRAEEYDIDYPEVKNV